MTIISKYDVVEQNIKYVSWSMCGRRFLHLIDVNTALCFKLNQLVLWLFLVLLHHIVFSILFVHTLVNFFFFGKIILLTSLNSILYSQMRDINLIEYSIWYFIIEFFENVYGAQVSISAPTLLYQNFGLLSFNSSIQWQASSIALFKRRIYTYIHGIWIKLMVLVSYAYMYVY